ncbi:Na+/H+ antiporter subunit E [Tranquillimonas alkanivorans]|uniref:Multisubunit sodium/proton antiporter, MrpE subunit n=1 Tax=Tranquillimonas alkanivorans TaxID=441119 RepID=A0A1I5Q1F5_9RHOB|nr:Na+/H+ antiporter subunit E [Tranquillimonas alkanivorans]SFP39860.1 multisubunit sodium/proton antiporter, MrpE subunit [Tranquillimonas alkanivorans]
MERVSVIDAARRGLVLSGVWLILTSADPGAYAVGAVTVAAATWLSFRLRSPRASPVNLLRAASLLPGFLWQSLLGGVDVARRALDPRLPLAPGWFVLPARLREGSPRVVLGGEFSLLPGTLVAGTRKDRFLVHVLDRTRPVEREFEAGQEEMREVFREVGS